MTVAKHLLHHLPHLHHLRIISTTVRCNVQTLRRQCRLDNGLYGLGHHDLTLGSYCQLFFVLQCLLSCSVFHFAILQMNTLHVVGTFHNLISLCDLWLAFDWFDCFKVSSYLLYFLLSGLWFGFLCPIYNKIGAIVHLGLRFSFFIFLDLLRSNSRDTLCFE